MYVVFLRARVASLLAWVFAALRLSLFALVVVFCSSHPLTCSGSRSRRRSFRERGPRACRRRGTSRAETTSNGRGGRLSEGVRCEGWSGEASEGKKFAGGARYDDGCWPLGALRAFACSSRQPLYRLPFGIFPVQCICISRNVVVAEQMMFYSRQRHAEGISSVFWRTALALSRSIEGTKTENRIRSITSAMLADRHRTFGLLRLPRATTNLFRNRGQSCRRKALLSAV